MHAGKHEARKLQGRLVCLRCGRQPHCLALLLGMRCTDGLGPY